MKKFIIILAFATILFNPIINATATPILTKEGNEQVSAYTLRQFDYSFPLATNITWSVNKNYQEATFLQSFKKMHAFYDFDDKFLGAVEVDNIDALSEKTKATLDVKYKGYTVENVVKVVERPADYNYDDDTNSYWVSLRGEGKKLFIKISPSEAISVVKTELITK